MDHQPPVLLQAQSLEICQYIYNYYPTGFLRYHYEYNPETIEIHILYFTVTNIHLLYSYDDSFADLNFILFQFGFLKELTIDVENHTVQGCIQITYEKQIEKHIQNLEKKLSKIKQKMEGPIKHPWKKQYVMNMKSQWKVEKEEIEEEIEEWKERKHKNYFSTKSEFILK